MNNEHLVFIVDDTIMKYYFTNEKDANIALLTLYNNRLQAYIKHFGKDLGYFDAQVWICICDDRTGALVEYLVPSVPTQITESITLGNLPENLKLLHVKAKAYKEMGRKVR